MRILGLTLILSISTVFTYKPVLIFHGMSDTPREMQFFADVIKKAHPNTIVHVIEALHTLASFLPLWHQIDNYQERAQRFMDKYPQGVHFIGYSQGGLVARGVIETSNRHNVNTFVSIIAPHMGTYGNMKKKFSFLVDWVPKIMYKLLYTSAGQHFSIGNFWRDPNHLKEYLTGNTFLPYLNNEIKHPCSKKFKRNFSKLKKLILIGLTDDKIMQPWITSQFGSLDKDGNLVDFRHQKIYEEDTLGLRKLDERGDVIMVNFSGVPHQTLQFSEEFVKKEVLPWLD